MRKNANRQLRIAPCLKERAIAAPFFAAKALTLVTALLLVFSVLVAHAMPIRYAVEELARMSDTIVVVHVESVRGFPLVGKRWAHASVKEVWKGPTIKDLEFLASPQDSCDISSAKKGEDLLLFLKKEQGLGWVITHFGRGRMPLRTIDQRECVEYFGVSFPKQMPGFHDPGQDSHFSGAFEIEGVRGLVRRVVKDETEANGLSSVEKKYSTRSSGSNSEAVLKMAPPK